MEPFNYKVNSQLLCILLARVKIERRNNIEKTLKVGGVFKVGVKSTTQSFILKF